MTKLLLVEDNELIREMLATRLGRKGYQVITAVDGVQGVAMAMSEQPSIIIMDMGLPILDGWTATKQLKATTETQAIPVIALTAHAIGGDREQALLAGCDDYETKPVNFPKLLAKLQAFLN